MVFFLWLIPRRYITKELVHQNNFNNKIAQQQSFLQISNISFMPKLRHISLLSRFFFTIETIINISRQFSQLFYLQLIQFQLFLFFTKNQQFLFLLCSFYQKFDIDCLNLLLPILLSIFSLRLQLFHFILQSLNHIFSNQLLTRFLSFSLFFVQSQFLLKLFYLLMFSNICIMGFVQSFLSQQNFIQQNFGLFSQLISFVNNISQFLAILLFIFYYFESFRLYFMNIQVALLLLLEYFQGPFQGFYLIFLSLNRWTIVNCFKLPFSNKYFIFQLLNLYVLLLQLKPFVSYILIFFINLKKPNTITFFSRFILQQNFIKLFSQFINLCFQFYILFYKTLLLILLWQQLLQMILGFLFILFIVFISILFGLKSLRIQKFIITVIRMNTLFFIHINLQPPINNLNCKLFFIHLQVYLLQIQSMRQNKTYTYDIPDSRSKSPSKIQDNRQQRMMSRYKIEQTRILMIEDAKQYLKQAQSMFTDLSIAIGTSVPDDVEPQGEKIYVKYPSIEAAKSVYQYLNGEVVLSHNKFKLEYYPKRRIDLAVSYDWYCQKCDYKNFARRPRCYRCQVQKTPSCRFSYSTQPQSKVFREQTSQNCSLMLRGPVVAQVEQQVLLQIFQAFAPVRDIRQIKNKLTGKFKDFAFVEFFTPQQTTRAWKQANEPDFKINGQKVSVLYSRSKAEDDYTKPLPYQINKKDKKSKQKGPNQDNYYHRQRQRQIEQEKARPTITMEQLKEKRELELKKNQQFNQKQLNQDQSKRRQAQILAKQWQKQMKTQTVMYICPLCSRKFQNAESMKIHEKQSQMHKFYLNKYLNSQLVL